MQISPILWLAAAVGFLALEASTFNMTSIWFAIGSAAALLCCVFTGCFHAHLSAVFLYAAHDHGGSCKGGFRGFR